MSTTEIILAGGQTLHVTGEVQQVEARIVGAARGSIMELAWMTDAETGRQIGINPDHVILIRAREGDPEPT